MFWLCVFGLLSAVLVFLRPSFPHELDHGAIEEGMNLAFLDQVDGQMHVRHLHGNGLSW